MANSTRNDSSCNLGIDLGTSSVKAVLAAHDGSVIRAATAPCTVDRPHPGWAEADPRHWWEAVVHAVSSLDLPGVHVAGIGISVFYPALVLFDRAMNPLRPAILYCDQRAADESRGLLERCGGEQAARALTGNAFPAGTASITSLLWIRSREPQIFSQAQCIGHANTYLVERLTGERVIDFSNASLSGFYDAALNRWSCQLCEIAGLAPSALPRLMPGCAMAGRLSGDAARQLGLQAGLPVAAGAGDTVCATLGIGAADDRELFLSCGSTNNFVRLSSAACFDNGLVNTSHLQHGTWLNVGTTNSSGAAIQWFVDNYLGPGNYGRFFELCAGSPAGAGGVVFLPYLAGERTPHYDPLAKAAFFGITGSTTLAHTARSVAEGVCFADRQILETFERSGSRVERIIAAGGGTRGEVLRRIRTDVIGREIAFSGISDASALGAALLGGIAGGCYADWREAAAVARRAANAVVLKPDSRARDAYDGSYRVYKELYPRVKDLFRPCSAR